MVEQAKEVNVNVKLLANFMKVTMEKSVASKTDILNKTYNFDKPSNLNECFDRLEIMDELIEGDLKFTDQSISVVDAGEITEGIMKLVNKKNIIKFYKRECQKLDENKNSSIADQDAIDQRKDYLLNKLARIRRWQTDEWDDIKDITE